MGKEEHHGTSIASNSDSFANRSRSRMAVQPTLGILAQRRDWNDPFDCLDSLVARVRLAICGVIRNNWMFEDALKKNLSAD
jgi:hypothetical protein